MIQLCFIYASLVLHLCFTYVFSRTLRLTYASLPFFYLDREELVTPNYQHDHHQHPQTFWSGRWRRALRASKENPVQISGRYAMSSASSQGPRR